MRGMLNKSSIDIGMSQTQRTIFAFLALYALQKRLAL
jgi:hypothetical protein